MRAVMVWFLSAGLAFGAGERAGDFDYYVMALSWSPTWCALEGDARASDQCHPRHDHGWTLHGLWPQYEDGWPSDCATSARDPSRRETAAMSDVMGSGGLAWHQWKKHGRCSGLTAQEYFERSREAYDQVNRPGALRKLERSVRIDPDVIEDAFLADNPQLSAEMLIVTCKQGHIQEARICLTKSLEPRPCSRSVGATCRLDSAVLDPVR